MAKRAFRLLRFLVSLCFLSPVVLTCALFFLCTCADKQHVHDPYGDGTENTLADRREKYKVSRQHSDSSFFE